MGKIWITPITFEGEFHILAMRPRRGIHDLSHRELRLALILALGKEKR